MAQMVAVIVAVRVRSRSSSSSSNAGSLQARLNWQRVGDARAASQQIVVDGKFGRQPGTA